MWDVIWYLGFPMFAVSVFGAPYKKYELGNDSEYSADQFDLIYDQRQNGSINVKFGIDGLSLIWSPNSLLAAAALLEPALYGEYPESSLDLILGPQEGNPKENDDVKPELEKTEKNIEQQKETSGVVPTVLVVSENQLTSQKIDSSPGSKRKFRLPAGLTQFLRKRSSPSKSSTTII